MYLACDFEEKLGEKFKKWPYLCAFKVYFMKFAMFFVLSKNL